MFLSTVSDGLINNTGALFTICLCAFICICSFVKCHTGDVPLLHWCCLTSRQNSLCHSVLVLYLTSLFYFAYSEWENIASAPEGAPTQHMHISTSTPTHMPNYQLVARGTSISLFLLPRHRFKYSRKYWIHNAPLKGLAGFFSLSLSPFVFIVQQKIICCPRHSLILAHFSIDSFLADSSDPWLESPR